MFGSLKIFYLLSFILIVTLTSISGLYFRGLAIERLSVSIERSHDILNDYFVAQVWSGNRNIESKLNQVSQLKDDPDFINFVQRSKDFASYLNVVKISIFNLKGESIFSNNNIQIADETSNVNRLIFNLNSRKDAFEKVISIKKTYSHIFVKGVYINSDGQYIEAKLLGTFIPIYSTVNPSNVIAIAEFVVDVSDEWDYIYNFQIGVSFGVIGIFITLYLTLIYNSFRAAEIIEKQSVENHELELAKVRAETENQEKSKFLANVSHELRTPLNAIIGFSEMIKNEVAGPLGNDTYRDYINDINNSGTHLLSLINDILDYSKAMADKLVVENVEVDVNKIIQNSLRLIKPRADQAKIQLITDLPSQHLVILGDPKRLKQVLLNLLSNSVKFTPEDHSVTTKASLDIENNEVVIYVIDTGIGISPKNIAKAMSSFGQVDNELSRKYEGTGLGLPLTKKLTELMNGKFDIKSQEGVGTTVTLSFKAVANPQNLNNSSDSFVPPEIPKALPEIPKAPLPLDLPTSPVDNIVRSEELYGADGHLIVSGDSLPPEDIIEDIDKKLHHHKDPSDEN